MDEGLAKYSYRDGDTFYFEIGDAVFGFVPDCGCDERFDEVIEAASESGAVSVKFLTRTCVLIEAPDADSRDAVLSESYSRIRRDADTGRLRDREARALLLLGKSLDGGDD